MAPPSPPRRRRAGEERASRPAPAPEPETPVRAAPARPVVDAPRTSEAPSARLDQDDLMALAQMDPSELAALMEGSLQSRRLEPGQRVTGTVTRVGRDTVFVDLGGKSEGQLERNELPEATVGAAVTAFVVQEDEQGVALSLSLSGRAASDHLEEARESGVPVEGKVVSRNTGGFEVRIGSVRAFCPASQISRLPEVDPDAFVGQTFQFRVLETGDKTVVSRRVLQQEEVEEKAAGLWQTLEPGQVLRGTVRSVQPFGFFVDVGGVDGLVPRREIGWKSEDPRTAVRLGQAVEVAVLEVDRANKKLTLSARALEDDPWGAVGTGFFEGGIYPGTVVRAEAYGVFVELAPGLAGLVHVSKLAAGAPEIGTVIDVRLLSVDHERRRLELSPVAAGAVDESGGEDVLVRGTVAEVLRNGVVVQLEDGRTGWLGENEVDLPSGTVLAQRFRKGKPVTARVIKDDPRRVTLSARTTRDEDEREWQAHRARSSGGGAGFGTLGDLLSGLKTRR